MRDNIACLLASYWMKYWEEWLTFRKFSACCCSVAQLCLTPMECSTPGFPVLHYLLEFAQSLSIETMMPSNHLILCCPVSSGPQSFLASQSFPKSWLFTSGGQSIGASASISVLPMNSQGWFPGLLISWLSKGLSRVFSSTTVGKHEFLGAQSSQ